jgi:hypothetical protein
MSPAILHIQQTGMVVLVKQYRAVCESEDACETSQLEASEVYIKLQD